MLDETNRAMGEDTSDCDFVGAGNDKPTGGGNIDNVAFSYHNISPFS